MQPGSKAHLLVFSLLIGFTLATPAAAQTYTTIDYPGSLGSFATDISDRDQIVWGIPIRLPLWHICKLR